MTFKFANEFINVICYFCQRRLLMQTLNTIDKLNLLNSACII